MVGEDTQNRLQPNLPLSVVLEISVVVVSAAASRAEGVVVLEAVSEVTGVGTVAEAALAIKVVVGLVVVHPLTPPAALVDQVGMEAVAVTMTAETATVVVAAAAVGMAVVIVVRLAATEILLEEVAVAVVVGIDMMTETDMAADDETTTTVVRGNDTTMAISTMTLDRNDDTSFSATTISSHMGNFHLY